MRTSEARNIPEDITSVGSKETNQKVLRNKSGTPRKRDTLLRDF